MQKKEAGGTVSNASKMKLKQSSFNRTLGEIVKRGMGGNSELKGAAELPFEFDSVVGEGRLGISLCIRNRNLLVGDMVRNNCG
jgi:hypothetical protein